MNRTRLAIASLLAATTFLAGCGGDDSSDKKSSDSSSQTTASTPAADAATGDEQSADGFTFNAPEGWKANDGSNLGTTASFEALAIDVNDKDGFSDNVNVVSDPTIAKFDDPSKLADAAKQGLSTIKTSDLKSGDPVTIDGEEAATLSFVNESQGTGYAQTQYYVGHGDQGYVITFSFSADRPAAERQEIAESTLASWKWKS